MSESCCYLGDYEMADVFRCQTRKAAKLHQCTECRREIAKGDRYEYTSMLADGHWSTSRTCSFCQALIRDYCDGIHIPGCLADILWDCIDYNLYEDTFREDPQ